MAKAKVKGYRSTVPPGTTGVRNINAPQKKKRGRPRKKVRTVSGMIGGRRGLKPGNPGKGPQKPALSAKLTTARFPAARRISSPDTLFGRKSKAAEGAQKSKDAQASERKKQADQDRKRSDKHKARRKTRRNKARAQASTDFEGQGRRFAATPGQKPRATTEAAMAKRVAKRTAKRGRAMDRARAGGADTSGVPQSRSRLSVAVLPKSKGKGPGETRTAKATAGTQARAKPGTPSKRLKGKFGAASARGIMDRPTPGKKFGVFPKKRRKKKA